MVMSNNDDAGGDKTYSHLIKTTAGSLSPIVSISPPAHSSPITAMAGAAIATHDQDANRLLQISNKNDQSREEDRAGGSVFFP